MTKKQEKETKKKSRNWQAVVYPESAPEDWQEILKSLTIPGFISPLHDKDKQPDGTDKKPHYHVILIWDGPTTYKNAKETFDLIGGVMQPIPIQSLTGATRYLCHMDDPDKYQYSSDEVQSLFGVDFFDQIAKNANDSASLRKLFQFIREEDITEYCDLIDKIDEEAMDEYFRLATKISTISIQAYLTSRRNKKRDLEILEKSYYFVDKETGEIKEV